MFEPHHFVDLQENLGFGDPKSWLSGDNNNSSQPHHRTQSSVSLASSAPNNGDVDRVLYNDLVEMIPLVQSLIERKANCSFTRRGSMIYTKTPSRESLSRKATDLKGRNAAQSIPVRKKKDQVDKNGCINQDGESFSIFSSRDLTTNKENEEVVALREQVEDLQRKLLEKDELLKEVEISKDKINDVHKELDKLKQHAAEKDSLVKSIQQQLFDAKNKLADKQAALEKTQWEATTSKQKVEMLQDNINSMQGEFSSFMMFLNGLTKNNSTKNSGDYDVEPYHVEELPYMDCMDENAMQKIEEARQAYIAALGVFKEKQDEESLAGATSARLYLQSFLFTSESLEETMIS